MASKYRKPLSASTLKTLNISTALSPIPKGENLVPVAL